MCFFFRYIILSIAIITLGCAVALLGDLVGIRQFHDSKKV